MQPVLIIGGSGFVGSSLVRSFAANHLVCFTYRSSRRIEALGNTTAVHLDIRDGSAVRTLLSELNPSVVIHAAGIKNVHACEKNPELAHAINAEGTRNVARACQETGSWLVILSTDLVFSCDRGWYAEDEIPIPNTAYGKSKLAGEEMAKDETDSLTVCRTGGIYGSRSPLLRWVAQELQSGRVIEAFTDVRNTPTYCMNLAEMLEASIRARIRGTLHMVGPERVSRFALFTEFARSFDFNTSFLRATEAGSSREDLLLHADASLDGDTSAELLGVPRDGVANGMTRLRAEGEFN